MDRLAAVSALVVADCKRLRIKPAVSDILAAFVARMVCTLALALAVM